MSLLFSSGLREYIAATGPLRMALNEGEIRVYSGPVPVSVDSAITGSNIELVTFRTDDDQGLTFDTDAPGGTLLKNPAEIWRGTVAASGTATFYRHVLPSDTGVASTSARRVQGSVGFAGTDMQLSNTVLAEGAIQSLEAYSITLPEV